MTPNTHPGVILIVEDNDDNRIIYGTILRAHGYEVREVTGGEAAVAAATSSPPDLVLMDIGLPGMDGVEATTILKGNPTTAMIPVVALTAHGLQQDRERAARAGFGDYLIKPVSSDVLVRTVRRVMATRLSSEHSL